MFHKRKNIWIGVLVCCSNYVVLKYQSSRQCIDVKAVRLAHPTPAGPTPAPCPDSVLIHVVIERRPITAHKVSFSFSVRSRYIWASLLHRDSSLRRVTPWRPQVCACRPVSKSLVTYTYMPALADQCAPPVMWQSRRAR